jgi:hypothetical protein
MVEEFRLEVEVNQMHVMPEFEERRREDKVERNQEVYEVKKS